jgi:threonine synthase
MAFKDFGARFMSRVMSYFLEEGEKQLDVLVATSGDTGGAVALGFLGVPNTRVTILYPKGKVSGIQEQQLTTNGQNIRALEVDGTFDDCQALVKQAFTDAELNEQYRLTSANSINIARLVPQTFYYFNAYAQLLRQGKNKVVFSVPSGNFGNIGAGLLAWKMGLPVEQFIAATNANDTVPAF